MRGFRNDLDLVVVVVDNDDDVVKVEVTIIPVERRK